MTRRLVAFCLLLTCSAAGGWAAGVGAPRVYGSDGTYLGNLSANQYDLNSTSNPFGSYGSPYSGTSINNQFGQFGSPYSSSSVNNPYAYNAPKIYAADGTYLGKLSSNPYDSESISNPYGTYGSPYSSTSINNPYGRYGSPYSSLSPNNPYVLSSPPVPEDLAAGRSARSRYGVVPATPSRSGVSDSYLASLAAETDRLRALAELAAAVAATREQESPPEARARRRPADNGPTSSAAWWGGATADSTVTSELNQWRTTPGGPADAPPPDRQTAAFWKDVALYDQMVKDGVVTGEQAASILFDVYGREWVMAKLVETSGEARSREGLGAPAKASAPDKQTAAFWKDVAFYDKMVKDGVVTDEQARNILCDLYGRDWVIEQVREARAAAK